jgi:2-keto-4-pentenoate hydratase/2-oxohepta-3-ene-1,7-dioic acid hydratase in catechol pathway
VKLATYGHGGVERAGVVRDGLVHPFDAGLPMADLIGLGLPTAMRLGRAALTGPGVPLDDVRLRAPLQPRSIRDFVAFEEHVEGVRRGVEGVTGVPDAWFDGPTFYFANPHTVLGPADEVVFPASSAAPDFELEVAVVVGRDGASLTPEQAREHVFGYTVLNDWSARDLQAGR